MAQRELSMHLYSTRVKIESLSMQLQEQKLVNGRMDQDKFVRITTKKGF